LTTDSKGGSNPPFAFLMRKLIFIPAIPIFLFIFFKFTSPPVWDYDFWWHLKTGELIVKEKRLPEKDTFTFTSEGKDGLSPGREKFLLRQYWLSQSLMYLIYSESGFSGIKVMRGGAITLTLIIFFITLSRRVPPLIAYGFLLLAADTFTRYTGERPQLFSFLFAMLLIVMLDRALKGKKDGWLIPLVMLLWANIHGGFILGDLFIAVYAVSENMRCLTGRKPLPKTFNIIAVTSILFSFINPNTYRVVFEMVNLEKYYTEGIQELKSPYALLFEKTRTIKASFLILLGIGILPLLKLIRKKDRKDIGWGRYFLIYLLMLMGIKSSRYIIFFATAGAWLMALEADWLWARIGRLYPRLKTAAAGIVIVSLFSFYSYKTFQFNFESVFSPSVQRSIYPFHAVDFIKENGIKGRLFNDYGWGGFLIWSLYPEKVFIDSRGLNYGSMVEYSVVVNAFDGPDKGKPLWEALLRSYGIDFILLPTVDFNGRLYPLTAALYENERWPLIYADYNSMLFARDSKENRDLIVKYRMPPEQITNAVITGAALYAGDSGINPSPFVTLGDAFVKVKKYEDAERAYRIALDKDPGNAYLIKALADLKRMDKE